MIAVTGFECVSDMRTTARADVEWSSLVSRLSTFDRRAVKDGPGWAPAIFTEPCTCGKKTCKGAAGHRVDPNVLELHALVFDLDKRADKQPLDEASANACLARLDELGLRRIVHTTYSHRPPDHWSLRVVISLSHPVPAKVWERFWRAAVAYINIHVEASCFNPSRFWFAPSAAPNGEPWSRSWDGPPLDVPMVLSRAEPEQPEQPRAKAARRTRAGKPPEFDIYRFVATTYPGSRPEAMDGGTRWEIECPWEHEHSSSSPRDTMISTDASGVLGFHCLHDHCSDRGWTEFRKHHEPDWAPFDPHASQDDISRARARKAAAAEGPTSTTADHPQLELRHAGIGPYGGYRLTDLGNARRFADLNRDRLRYVKSWDRWLVWDGKRWNRDELGVESAAAKQVAAHIYQEVAQVMQATAAAINGGQSVSAPIDELTKWARDSSKAGRLSAMIELAGSEPEIATTSTAWDADRWALNVNNGTIDLQSGELRPHRRTDMFTMLAPVDYDPAAQCPRFEAFLEHVQPDPEVRAWIQRYLGYALTGDVREQCLAFCFGGGSNGKSVLLDIVLDLLGGYGLRAAPDLVLAKHGEAHPTELADLEGRRLVVCSEIEQGRMWAESTIKRITGDRTITARRMRQDFYTFPATHKLVVAANTKPKVRGTDHGIWRRMKLVPWLVTIPDEQQDKTFPAQLLAAEAAGIMAWLVRGCLAWQNHGLGTASAIATATKKYQLDNDVIQRWIGERCVLEGWESITGLYDDFARWCAAEERQKQEQVWGYRAWRDNMLERRGIEEARRDHGKLRVLTGIQLKGIYDRKV